MKTKVRYQVCCGDSGDGWIVERLGKDGLWQVMPGRYKQKASAIKAMQQFQKEETKRK